MVSKKTKIICTIGPASWDPATLEEMAVSGMDIARLNFSHGNHEEKQREIIDIRAISKKLNKPLAIIADLQGPKLRLGKIEGEFKEDGERDSKQRLSKGEVIHLSLSPLSGEIPVQFDLSPFMKKGQRILLNDGLVELKVLAIKGRVILAKVQNDGYISSNKGINVPDTNLPGASLKEKDISDAIFALKQDVDYLALSFVQTSADIKKARDLIKKFDAKTKIIAKLEKPQAITRLEEIIADADAVMVARGDLAIETKASQVPIIQHEIIRLCRQQQKPVIIATHMLESMIENPRPTRAEVSDVANAVLSEVDAVMLSGESANGKYPVEAVKLMAEVILSVEQNPEYKRSILVNWENFARENISLNAIVSSAGSLAYRINARLIIVATASGRTAQLIASFRPISSIMAVTHDTQVSRQLNLVWGIETVEVEPVSSPDLFSNRIIQKITKINGLRKGDKIVMVIGTQIGQSGDTNTIKVITF